MTPRKGSIKERSLPLVEMTDLSLCCHFERMRETFLIVTFSKKLKLSHWYLLLLRRHGLPGNAKFALRFAQKGILDDLAGWNGPCDTQGISETIDNDT